MVSSSFSKFTAAFTGIRPSSWRREAVAFAAVAVLGALAAVLFAVDGYVLYRSHFRPQTPIASARKDILLAEQDIDEALLLLDAREKKMEALLGGE